MRARQLTWWIAGLLLLGLWSSFCLSARELHPLGVFNDDACYYLNAVAWQRGEPLPFPNYFPGQSVFLLGAVWMLGPDPGALRLVPLLPTLLTAPAIYFALRGRSQWMALSVAVLYLFTPLVVRNSTTLLSEPLFGMLAWTALAVLTARRGSRAAILAGLLLALAWQTRPTGSFVAFGVILGLVSEKRWRDAGLVLASFAALFLAFSLFRPTAGGVYVDALLGYDFLRPDYALKWLLGFLDMAGTMVFYYLPPVLIRPLAGLGLLIGIIGCVRQWSSYRLAMTCAIVFSLGHLVWPFHMARYWLLPFPIFLLGVLGAFPRRAQGAVAAGLALLCLAGDLQAVQLARLRYEQEAGRRALTGWLRRETAPDAKILTPYSAQVAMLTERPAVQPPPLPSLAEWTDFACGSESTYILTGGGVLVDVNGQRGIGAPLPGLEVRLSSSPYWKLRFATDSGAVYERHADRKSFLPAMKALRAAYDHQAANRPAEALLSVEECLRLLPELPEAQFLRAQLRSQCGLPGGLEEAREVVSRHPGYPEYMTWVADGYLAQNQKKEAALWARAGLAQAQQQGLPAVMQRCDWIIRQCQGSE